MGGESMSELVRNDYEDHTSGASRVSNKAPWFTIGETKAHLAKQLKLVDFLARIKKVDPDDLRTHYEQELEALSRFPDDSLYGVVVMGLTEEEIKKLREDKMNK